MNVQNLETVDVKSVKNVGERTFGQRTILSTNTKLLSMGLKYLRKYMPGLDVGDRLHNPKGQTR